MSDPIFLTSSILSKIIDSSGREKTLRCLFSNEFERHVSTSVSELYESSMGKVLGRFNDYNPVSMATWGGFYVCTHCGMPKFDGGLLSDIKNNQLTKDAKEYLTFYKIGLKNKTSEHVVVALHYCPFDNSSDKQWITLGWGHLAPREESPLIWTSESCFYYHIISETGSWEGTDYFDFVGDSEKKIGFRKKNFAVSAWKKFTLNITE